MLHTPSKRWRRKLTGRHSSSRVALSHHGVLQVAVSSAAEGRNQNTLHEMASIYESREELQDAATGVTECLKELIDRRLARWLPLSA